MIRNNRLVDNGGSTTSRYVSAINVSGAGVEITGNTIADIIAREPDGIPSGISVGTAPGAVIENNRIANSALGDEDSYGIRIGVSEGVSVVNNRISNLFRGVWMDGSTTGKYRDNLTNNVSIPYAGGTDAGNND